MCPRDGINICDALSCLCVSSVAITLASGKLTDTRSFQAWAGSLEHTFDRTFVYQWNLSSAAAMGIAVQSVGACSGSRRCFEGAPSRWFADHSHSWWKRSDVKYLRVYTVS